MDNLETGQEPIQPADPQIPTPATPAPKTYKIIKKKLTEKQEQKAIELITEENNKSLDTYDNYDNGKGWFTTVDDSTQDYKDGNYSDLGEEDDSEIEKKRIMWTTMACDIVASKEKWQTQGAFPQILLVPKPADKLPGKDGKLKWEANDLTDRQDRLDYILRKDCKKEEVNYVSTRMACANGVAIEAYKYEKIVEYKTRKTLYDKSKIAEFEKNYAADLMNPKSKAFKNWSKLQAGEEVEITDIEPITVFNGVKPYRVDLHKFIARLDIKDFRRHKVISEIIDTYNWADIEARTATDDNDPYGYDQDAVNRLKEKLNGDSKTGDSHLTSKNEMCESVVFIKFESEVKEGEDKPTDRYQRYCITHETEHKIVLKCIHYPYEHNDPIYVAKCPIPRDDSWAGYSFSARGKDGKTFAEGLLNSMLRQFQLSEAGVILTDDKETDFSRFKINNGDGMSVIKAKTGANISQFQWAFPNIDRPGLINWMQNYNALLSGVDPALNSGAQTPDDPQAPMGKMLAKQKISDKRIEDIILNLQKADELGARMVDYTYNQFVEEEPKPYFDGDYVCHGSTLSFNPKQDNQLILMFDEWLSKSIPMIKQDTNYNYTMANALINNAGGSIKKNKEIILKPLKDQLDLEEATAQLIKKFTDIARQQGESGMVIRKIQEFVVKALQSGRSEEEISEAMPQVIEAIKAQPEQPMQGQPGQISEKTIVPTPPSMV